MPPLLGPLVAEHRPDAVELGGRQRLFERVLDERPHHAWRRLRPQRDALAALVGEAVHLFLDDIGRLARSLREQLLPLDDRRTDLVIAVMTADVAGNGLETLPALDFSRHDVVGTTDGGDHDVWMVWSPAATIIPVCTKELRRRPSVSADLAAPVQE